jgi:hypothetical protein
MLLVDIFLKHAGEIGTLHSSVQAFEATLRESSPVIAALTGIVEVTYHPLNGRRDIFNALLFKIGPDNSWKIFWDWIVAAARACISDRLELSFRRCLHQRIDHTLFWILELAPHFRERIQSRADVFTAFHHLWLADPVNCTVTLSFPSLIPEIFPASDMLQAMGNSVDDLVKSNLNYVSYLKRCKSGDAEHHSATFSRPTFFLMWGPLLHSIQGYRECLAVHGGVPILAKFFDLCVAREVEDCQEGEQVNSDEEVFALADLLCLVANTMSLDPEYIAQAVDKGFLIALLDTGVFWEQRYGENALGQLKQGIMLCLKVLEDHVYHRHVWRHMKRRFDPSDDMHFYIRAKPLYQRWRKLRENFLLAGNIYEEYKRRGPHICANRDVNFPIVCMITFTYSPHSALGKVLHKHN